MRKDQVRIVEIREAKEGMAEIEVKISPKFRRWFIKKEGLKRWSQKRFQKRFLEEISRRNRSRRDR